jgi:hypothetical protein
MKIFLLLLVPQNGPGLPRARALGHQGAIAYSHIVALRICQLRDLLLIIVQRCVIEATLLRDTLSILLVSGLGPNLDRLIAHRRHILAQLGALARFV